MPNVLQRSAEKVTGSLSGPFHEARLVLTAIYMVLLAIILVTASAVTYSTFSSRLTYRVTRLPEKAPFERDVFVLSPTDVRKDLLHTLLLVNGILIAGAGAASYFLAGLTLRPIQHAYQRQQQFIGDASHELRTPLTILHAELENELRGTPEKENRARLESKLEEVDRMSRLVADLLTLSRTDEGSVAITATDVDLATITRASCERLKPLAAEHNIQLAMTAPSSLVVVGNSDLLGQAITNVVKNALTYNKPGGRVDVHVMREKTHAVIQVTDTGIGIAPEELPHIFDRFYRIDKSRSRSLGGSGLGLSIVQSIIQLFEGTIDVASNLNEGTVITLKVPIPTPSRELH